MELENLSAQLKSLSKQDWQKLFDLIPEIEATREFSTGGDAIEDENDPDGYIITQEIEAPIVVRFRVILEELDLLFGFNWTGWDEGKRIFRKKEFENLDTITCLKLINALIRSDHFSHGAALASRFQDGTIEKILKEIKKNVDDENT
ncbi:MAG TPA: DUF6508 domain-containing protein [Bacteroidales bacterium]